MTLTRARAPLGVTQPSMLQEAPTMNPMIPAPMMPRISRWHHSLSRVIPVLVAVR